VSLDLLHPAQRRRLAPMMPPEPHHEMVLRPIGAGDSRSIIATSRIVKFVQGLFEDLQADDWKTRLAAMRGIRHDPDRYLKLSLPIHRSHQIALFEVVCLQPGSPRLDPKKIVSQGLVIRRYRANRWQGWMNQGKKVSGWLPIGLTDADPDPVKRQASHPANRAAREAIAKTKAPSNLAEEVVDLYLVPPDVCAARGRTILFAVLPIASDARSDDPPPRIDYASLPREDLDLMVGHLSEYLKERPKIALPRAGQVLSKDWNINAAPPRPPATPAADAGQLASLGTFLQQLIVELDWQGASPGAKAMRALFANIFLPTRDEKGHATTISAADFAAKAGPILLGGEDNKTRMVMPLEWPRIDAATGQKLTRAALDCLSARHAQLVTSPGKFEIASDLFAVRGFLRVKGPDGCPDKLVWSAPSELFRVAAWWDGDGPTTKISLPDISQLGKLKPNVAFEMPPFLGNLLKGDMKKLSDGEGSEPSKIGLGWLCSFSIPIITLCAFIVLNIFLSLFDIFLRWMLFIKICIPIPVPKEGG
jgi:hypothetical protein